MFACAKGPIGTEWTAAVQRCALLALLLIPVAATNVRANDHTDDLFEVYWEFKYGGIVDAVIGSYYDGTSFYLSLSDLFGALQLNLMQDTRAMIARGFYLDTSRQYLFEFGHGKAQIDKRVIPIDTTDFVESPLGYFLRPAVFDSVFGLSVDLNERQLIVSIAADEEMPVLTTHRRRLARVVRTGRPESDLEAPLLYGRRRRVLGGGVVGYRLSTVANTYDPLSNLNLRGGGELLGGDLEAGFDATYAPYAPPQDQLRVELDAWRWRYVVQDRSYLTQANAGLLTSDGLRSFSFTGIGFSNEPVHLEESYGTYPLRVESEPGWEIEVFVNNRMIHAEIADATGFLDVAIPITYGSTNVIVREYGPSGEFRETERRVQVPFTFVPSGAIRYALYAGRGRFQRNDLVQASAAVGMTNWLTARVGFEYVTPDTTLVGEQLARVPWTSLSARIGAPYIVTVQAAPGARYGGSFSAYFPSLASYSLEFYHYDQNPIFNRQRSLHETRLNVILPFKVGGLPIHFRTNLFERKIATEQYVYSATQDVVLQPGQFRASFTFRANGSMLDRRHTPGMLRIEPRIGYAIAHSPSVPAFIRGLLVSLRAGYDLRERDLLSLDANLSKSVTRRFRVQTDFGRQLRTGTTVVTVRALLNLNRVRTSTNAYLSSAGPASVSQDVVGALSYNPGTARLGMSDQNWVGRAAATVRFYVDYDGNGRKNGQEPFIDGGGVQFRRSVTTRTSSTGHVLVHNLLPYERYEVTVDQARIRNPLWVPRDEQFSFIADPNVHKVLDIPFYVSGEISGSVLQAHEGALRPVPGLKMQLRERASGRVWQEAVFSDGSFYKIGLPPGDYEARVDSTQLEILGAFSDPPFISFTVRATELGDLVEGLDFVLKDKRSSYPSPEPAALRTR